MVRYIGTVAPQVMWRSSMPSSISASSNENEQPSTKATRSSRQCARTSVGLVHQLAVPEHAIARDVGADVEIVGERRQPPVAGRGRREQRARFRIELAEPQEVGRQRRRQDREIALHVAGRQPRGLPGEIAARHEARLAAGLRGAVLLHGCNCHGVNFRCRRLPRRPQGPARSCLSYHPSATGKPVESAPGMAFAKGKQEPATPGPISHEGADHGRSRQ